LYTRWFCSQSESLQGETDGPDGTFSSHSTQDDKIFHKVLEVLHPTKPRSFDREDIYERWWTLVELHSARKLSFQEDKLVSLAAIAEVFGAIFQDEYICGHWKQNLFLSLHWTVAEFNHPQSQVPEKYVCPSWSWAAQSSSVLFFEKSSINDNQFGLRPDEHFRVKSHGVELTDQKSPFGGVKYGFLEVQGCIRAATYKLLHPGQGSIFIDDFSGHGPDYRKSISKIEFTLDEPDSIPSMAAVYLLLLSVCPSIYTFNGIALSSDSNEFRRIGMFRSRRHERLSIHAYNNIMDWFHELGPCIIRII
jgi:hypothetical protein